MTKRNDNDDVLRYRFTSWLTVLLKRAKSRYLLKLKNTIPTYPIDWLPEELFFYEYDFRPAKQVDFYFENEKLLKAYKDLAETWRKILVMIFIEEKTTIEISRELNISSEQIWKIRSLALKRLREALYYENEQ
ncbi:MAG: hypothetical protein IJB34_03770 [Clostridia bacterium]|nr:hypothetical protein [Clostridia bacterium]